MSAAASDTHTRPAVRPCEPPVPRAPRAPVQLGGIIRARESSSIAAYGLHGPSSPRPPVQPDVFLELSGQRRRSMLDEEVRYQPTLMFRVAVVVPINGHEEPASLPYICSLASGWSCWETGLRVLGASHACSCIYLVDLRLKALHQYPGAQLADICRDTVSTSTSCASVTLKPSAAERLKPPQELTVARRFASLPAAVEVTDPRASGEELPPSAAVSELSVSKTSAIPSTKSSGVAAAPRRWPWQCHWRVCVGR
eukprot:scaffold27425_cov69-Phaeocystis_antarctica.AAC.10